MKRLFFLAGVIGAWLVADCRAGTTVQPEARVQTAPVPHKGDAADDPAVWIHPQDPGLSLILGTDKLGGLRTYNMDGSELEVVSDGTKPNNVDVLYGFKLNGRKVDLAVATVRGGKKRMGAKVWAIDPATRRLSDVTDGTSIRVLGGKEPMGACGYRSARTGRFYFFVSSEKGYVEQYELTDTGGGRVNGGGGHAIASSQIGSGYWTCGG